MTCKISHFSLFCFTELHLNIRYVSLVSLARESVTVSTGLYMALFYLYVNSQSKNNSITNVVIPRFCIWNEVDCHKLSIVWS